MLQQPQQQQMLQQPQQQMLQQPQQQMLQQPGGGVGYGGDNFSSIPQPEQPLVEDTPLSVKLDSHPLVGEFSFFDGSFYLGFWREPIFRGPEDVNPHNAQVPPGKTLQAMQAEKATAATLARFKPPEACRYGDRCKHKLSCSRYHGRDPVLHAVNCACEDDHCPKGHPLRAGRERGSDGAIAIAGGTAAVGATRGHVPGKRPPPNYVCAKCKTSNDHYLNECPQNVCHRCGQMGHIATFCPAGRSQGGAGGGGTKREHDPDDPQNQLRRMDNGTGYDPRGGGGSSIGGSSIGGGIRLE